MWVTKLLIAGSFGGLVGGCKRGGCTTQDTYLLYTYQKMAVQWKPVSYHTVGQEGKEGEACAPRDLSHHGDLDHNRQRHLLPLVM